MKLPMPFTVTIHGIGYQTSDESPPGVVMNMPKVAAALEATFREHVLEGIDVELQTVWHAFSFRHEPEATR